MVGKLQVDDLRIGCGRSVYHLIQKSPSLDRELGVRVRYREVYITFISIKKL